MGYPVYQISRETCINNYELFNQGIWMQTWIIIYLRENDCDSGCNLGTTVVVFIGLIGGWPGGGHGRQCDTECGRGR